MRLKTAFFLVLWLSFTENVLAQVSNSVEFLSEAFHVETSEALATILEKHKNLSDPTMIWREAVGISRTELAEEAVGRAAIVRLMEAALLRSGAVRDTLPLDQISKSDLSAMKSSIGFLGDDDLLHFLFTRDPSLRDEFEFESYAIVRIILTDLNEHVIRERSDRPYRGLTTSFSEQFIPAAEDPVKLATGERARTRRFNLAALGDIIVAAKAYRAAERAQDSGRMYALLIAADALERAFRANPDDFRLVPYRAHWIALRALREPSENDEFLKQELNRLEFAIPRSAFFARQFDDAEEAYRAAPISQSDARGRLWSSWGQAISIFAKKGEASTEFSQVAELLTLETLTYARMFQLLLRHLGSADRDLISGSGDWEDQLSLLLGENNRIANNRAWLTFNQDFLRILENIGRPDVAARYLTDEIKRIDRNTPEAIRELQMVIWLAPFIDDYCRLISFEMSSASGWRLRDIDRYNLYLDFLHSINESGELVRPGEVVQILDEPGPYGAISPEEDCATTLAVYGIADSDLFGLSKTTSSENAMDIVAGLEDWVLNALNRTDPAPSAVPYLKLVWIEWFSQAFQPLTTPGITLEQYAYRPIKASRLTTKDAVIALMDHKAVTQHDREILELFLSTRSILEKRYP